MVAAPHQQTRKVAKLAHPHALRKTLYHTVVPLLPPRHVEHPQVYTSNAYINTESTTYLNSVRCSCSGLTPFRKPRDIISVRCARKARSLSLRHSGAKAHGSYSTSSCKTPAGRSVKDKPRRRLDITPQRCPAARRGAHTHRSEGLLSSRYNSQCRESQRSCLWCYAASESTLS